MDGRSATMLAATTVVAAFVMPGCVWTTGPMLDPTRFEVDFDPLYPMPGEPTQMTVTATDPNEPSADVVWFETHVVVPSQIELRGNPYWNGTIKEGGSGDHTWTLVPREPGNWTLILNATNRNQELQPQEATLRVRE